MLWILLGIIISYCIGSFPTAFVFGRLIKGIDIRQFGSGNVGATNALRVLGKKVGITVLCIDIAKGFICVFVIGYFFQGLIPETLAIVSRLLFGVSCIIGHNWTIFLQFKGGKGVASTLGVLIGLAATIPGLYIVLLLVLATWGLVFLFSRIVSLASILAGISMPFYMWFFKQTPVIIVAGAALAVLGILRHKTNLKRIFLGTEPKLSFKKK